MNKKIMTLLFELMKNSKRSDRELAKVLGVSQATVSRMRNKLVKDRVIDEFTVIPNFIKIGYELLAITCFKSKITKELTEKARKVTMSRPNIVLAARCEGMGKNAIVLSLHRNYTEYSNFLAELVEEGGDDVESYDTLIVSLGGLIVKPFSLKYLAEQERTK